MFAGCIKRVVVLYSTDCVGNGLRDSTLVILHEWLSYRVGHISRFGCIIYKMQSQLFCLVNFFK